VTATKAQHLADLYIAQWMIPDAAQRRAAIENLWASDGTHVLRPPAEIREIAAGIGFDDTTLEAKGYDAIEIRVARSFVRFVEERGFIFRARPNAEQLNAVVKFNWEMVSPDSGEAVGGGLEFLILDERGRITMDYMFPGL
jgi:hypothetical protein